MTMRRSFTCAILTVLLQLAATPAWAQDADRATALAKQHNQRAKVLFNTERFAEAAAEYLKAYEAKPAPGFLFNLAQCHKRIGGAEAVSRAIFYYRSFLKNDPVTPMRQDVEAEIAKLEAQLHELRRPPPIYKRWWFWTAIGVALAGVTVGTAVGLRPRDEQPAAVTVGTYVVR
jgi:hypothetical protein